MTDAVLTGWPANDRAGDIAKFIGDNIDVPYRDGNGNR